MRRADGKDCGYVIVPIPVLKGDDPEYILNKNKRYEQIAKIVRAILAHDDALQRMLNTYHLSKSSKSGTPPDPEDIPDWLREWLDKVIGEGISKELYDEVKNVVLNLGDPSYYNEMGRRLGEQSVIIEAMLKYRMKHKTRTAPVIKQLHANLQQVVGRTITIEQTTKAISQHIVMHRIFNALFPESNNPVATAMESVVSKLKISGQLKEFEAFYMAVSADISHMTKPEEKQEFIKTIYDSFFKGADKRSATKHGIVYTPIEIVDFIINSVQHVLKTEFGKSMDDETITILDPFTGTGSFTARLLESGFISQNMLYHKYKNDIYANEIMLPAYYTTAANIEAAYQSVKDDHKYMPFKGATYMDTFDQHPLYRTDGRFRAKQASLTDNNLKEAHTRTKKQGMDIVNIVMGNPPYSAGQKSANEDNQNVSHPDLELKIKNTYVKRAPKGNKVSLYNSYIKAIRWASDRIEDLGIIGFITPSSYLTGNAEAGLRACLYEEFSDIWVFDLRGDAKLQGESRKKTGGGIFAIGSREPVAITILVKNPQKSTHTIHYKAVDDYLSREQKLELVKRFRSVSGINDWQIITPDKYNDWLNQRGEADETFQGHTPMGSKEGKKTGTRVVFNTYSNGLKTHRDVWVYNSSINKLVKNMKRHIDYCNMQDPDNFKIDPKYAAWSTDLSATLKKLPEPPKLDKSKIRNALYRPFLRQYLYFDPVFVTAKYQIPKFFPHGDTENLAILVPDKIKGEFSSYITDTTPDLHIHEAAQCFPYRKTDNVRNEGSIAISRYQDIKISRYQDIKISRYQSVHNSAVQNQGEFSVFITAMTPDLQVVQNGQVFPMKVMEQK